jgi:hypothetical protein
LKNAFVVFVVAWLAFAFGSEARSEDIRGLKLNQSIVGLLASEPSLAENVLEIANTMDHTDGLRALPIIGRGSLQSINDLLFWCGVDVAGPANSDEFIAAELVFGALGTNYERVPTTGKNLHAALLDGRIDAAVFTGADAYTLLNSIRAKSGLAFSVQAAGSQ